MATNIGLLYPKVRNNSGRDIPVDVPPTKILGDVSPASPAGLTPVVKWVSSSSSSCSCSCMVEYLSECGVQPSGAVSVEGKSSDTSLLSSIVDEVKSVAVSQPLSHAH